MLGLKLRDEFLAASMPGTTIALRTNDDLGAVQKSAPDGHFKFMTANHQRIVMGQRKWKVQGGFPHVCHGGMSLLEVAVPWIELQSL